MAERRRKKRDYYEVLEVSPRATDADLKRAYREQARKYHPDISDQMGAEDRFKEVNEAYAVLSDPQKRSRYDRYGFAGIGEEDVGGGLGAVVDAFDDLLTDLFKRKRGKKRGRDLRYTLELELDEAVFGCSKTIRVPRREGGASREYTVTVPVGAKDGQVCRLEGKGERGQGGGSAGDLNVILRVRPHPLFERDGDDIWCEIPISVAKAALGSVLQVPTLTGTVKMRVPEGTQSGRVFRMRGKGVPKGRGAGDQMVRIVVETPTNLSERQRQLLEDFERESGGEVAHPQERSFLDKVRTFFGE